MAAIGSLVFCTDCGNLLPSTKGSEKNVLTCDSCSAEMQGTTLSDRRMLSLSQYWGMY